MSLTKVVYFQVYCDTCSRQFDPTAKWATEEIANRNARQRGWTIGSDGTHHCPGGKSHPPVVGGLDRHNTNPKETP